MDFIALAMAFRSASLGPVSRELEDDDDELDEEDLDEPPPELDEPPPDVPPPDVPPLPGVGGRLPGRSSLMP
jgi:hypothetical protein